MAPGMRRNKSMPSSRKPEPPSQMNSVSSTRISTHDVLPPYFFDALPGVGIEPRVPQNRTKNATLPSHPPSSSSSRATVRPTAPAPTTTDPRGPRDRRRRLYQ